MTKPIRHIAAALHVITSVGWMGAGAANVVLASVAMTTADPALRSTCYYLIERLDAYLVIPLAFAALTTGVTVAACTPWGLTRYWWVVVKLVLTIAVIVFSTFVIGVWVQQSIDSTRASDTASPVELSLTVGAATNLTAFAFMTWISLAKPWGHTPTNPPRRLRPSIVIWRDKT